jgi:hypothetical protein
VSEENNMFKRNVIRRGLAAGLVMAAAGVPCAAQAAGTTAQTTAQKAAATVTTAEANAMQAAVVAQGEANSVLSNPYIEQKVTTPESVGVNRTKIPAGGF